jgi:hypothetical protein
MLLGLAGPAHATDPAPADAAQSAPSPERAGDPDGNEPDRRTAEGTAPEDDGMLEYLDILLEMKVLDSMETIETLQSAGEDDDQ